MTTSERKKTTARKTGSKTAKTAGKAPRPEKRAPRGRLPVEITTAIEAAQGKKATHVVVLNLKRSSAFTDYFVLCTGHNVRQVTAIADAVQEALKGRHLRPAHVEGYDRAEWVLIDYFDFIIHVFTPATREFYSLDRLWGQAERIEIPDPA
jgi:ribosome-associated protein